VPDPASTDVTNRANTLHVRWSMLNICKDVWLNPVDQASPHGLRCIFDNEENGDGNGYTYDRIF
jgi:hypothetical protein